MKIAFVFGTRPEVIKLAPVIKEAYKNFHEVETVAVLQHTNLLFQAMQDFQIKHTLSLSVERESNNLHELSAQVISKLGVSLGLIDPDFVVVQGDTATAFCAAYAAFLYKIPVAHVEAGLRTYDLHSPFPEEASRQMIARISSMNFCVDNNGAFNLNAEECLSRIKIVGNTIVDAVNLVKDGRPLREKHVLITLHRRENDSEKLGEISQAIKKFALMNPDWSLSFPCHPNPRIMDAVDCLYDLANLKIMAPVGYKECIRLIQKSSFVVTDSGGIQEECGILGVPALVCRENTERMQSVEAGASVLVGSDQDKILAYMIEMTNNERRSKYEKVVTAYGDGLASQRIIAEMESYHAKKD